jgi:ATP-dependent DNA helicase RecG
VIPLKIETLLEGQVVERNRVEYKEGWNPSDIVHTICAFANDYANVNGGYLVVGVAADEGIPVLPPKGVEKERVDSIQQEIFQYCNRIEPRYIPTIEVVNYPDNDTHLIYLKCSAGDAGPYQAPVDVYSKKQSDKKPDTTMKYWIRPGSLTTAAKPNEISELYEKFNSVPYDDRINRMATIDNIRRGYLEDFLRDSNSTLVNELNVRTLEDLLLSLEVANETDTDLALRNIGILMFSERPEKLIPGAQINLVKFNTEEAEASSDFIEKTFTGPIWKQVRDALAYIETTVIEEKVVKIKNQAEADRYYNYPYNALEEALVNAVFHKSYREGEPVEIRIYVDCIQIINYPGPDKWIDMDKFATGKVRARKYRNRRIGEFFKEIDLSEKQGTGIPTILSELKKNGSPLAEFETDEDRTFLIVTIRKRDGFENKSNVSKTMSESMSKTMSESMSELEMGRMKIVLAYLKEKDSISSTIAASILDVQIKTASRLLKQAEEIGLLKSEGRTRDKIYKIK